MSKWHFSFSDPSPTDTAKSIAQPSQIPKALPPYNITGVLRQRNVAQMKEEIKTLEKELND